MTKKTSTEKTSKTSKLSSKKVAEIESPRTLKTPKYRSFSLQKSIKNPRASLPSVWHLVKQSLVPIKQQWRTFLGIIIIYTILNIVLVQGFNFSNNDLNTVKAAITGNSDGIMGHVATGLVLFSYMLGISNNLTGAASAYQFMLTLTTSLAIIWTLRQAYAGKKVGMRDGFYRGMHPLVPFLVVLVVIGVQLVPFGFGVWLYNSAMGTGIIAVGAERLLWLIFMFLMALWSFYMVSASLFGLYIVSLADMTPLKALRSAKDLVLYRRWAIMRKLFGFIVLFFLASAVVILPLLLFATLLAGIVFFLVSMLGLLVVHSFMYTLYRELLR